jgi:hypothetical protein
MRFIEYLKTNIAAMKDVEAIIIDDKGQMYYSPGLRQAARTDPAADTHHDAVTR